MISFLHRETVGRDRLQGFRESRQILRHGHRRVPTGRWRAHHRFTDIAARALVENSGHLPYFNHITWIERCGGQYLPAIHESAVGAAQVFDDVTAGLE